MNHLVVSARALVDEFIAENDRGVIDSQGGVETAERVVTTVLGNEAFEIV